MKETKTHIAMFGTNIAVSLEKAAPKEIGGIHLPEKTNGFDGQAIAMFIGPACAGIRQGDRLIVPNAIGKSALRCMGKDYLIFKQEDVIGKITEA